MSCLADAKHVRGNYDARWGSRRFDHSNGAAAAAKESLDREDVFCSACALLPLLRRCATSLSSVADVVVSALLVAVGNVIQTLSAHHHGRETDDRPDRQDDQALPLVLLDEVVHPELPGCRRDQAHEEEEDGVVIFHHAKRDERRRRREGGVEDHARRRGGCHRGMNAHLEHEGPLDDASAHPEHARCEAR
eukprot:scaffold48_cov311-Pinguiococcus_pyrenoidosus.AAC.133